MMIINQDYDQENQDGYDDSNDIDHEHDYYTEDDIND